MRSFVCTALFLTLILFVPTLISARHIARQHSHHGHHHPTLPNTGKSEKVGPNVYAERRPLLMHRKPDTVQIAGSTLPDCSHACGSCSPCRLVMVSFVCASLAEAETCPMAYKCMCKNKSYPVP